METEMLPHIDNTSLCENIVSYSTGMMTEKNLGEDMCVSTEPPQSWHVQIWVVKSCHKQIGKISLNKQK